MTIILKRTFVSLGLLAFSFGAFAQQADMQFWRRPDQKGIHTFETTKQDTLPFDGIKVRVGGAFTQQYQGLSHSNNSPGDTLYALSNGFNLATANLNLDVQLEDGIRLNLITYLSSRHHPEAWVKGGYLQFDKLAFLGSDKIDKAMEMLTIRVGHMEVNYGDAHFRRTDNGNAMYNPFVGNLIMDGFATEIGGDVTFQKNGVLAMLGLTTGEIAGNINDDPNRGAALQAKLGYDSQINEDTRVRLTGSLYTSKSSKNTLYGGDRGGSRYYLVMEDQDASAGNNFTSGRVNPGFSREVTSIMINPFVKWKGLEFFGTFETSTGKGTYFDIENANTAIENQARTVTQISGELMYRFFKKEQVFVTARYTTVSGPMSAYASGEPVNGVDYDRTINRIQAGAGWFITPNILAKIEYVNQDYLNYPSDTKLSEGNFNGIMIEGVVAF